MSLLKGNEILPSSLGSTSSFHHYPPILKHFQITAPSVTNQDIMKLNFFLILPITAVLGGVFERNSKPGCNADNCARAVTGTRLGPVTAASHVADCQSFQQVTTFYGMCVSSCPLIQVNADSLSGTPLLAQLQHPPTQVLAQTLEIPTPAPAPAGDILSRPSRSMLTLMMEDMMILFIKNSC